MSSKAMDELNITFQPEKLWDDFYELARDHAAARCLVPDQYMLNLFLEPEDFSYAAKILVAAQPFYWGTNK